MRARTGGGTDQCKWRERNLDRAGAGSFADHKIEFVIFHRRIEDFFHHRIEAVDFVDEQHIARFEIGEDRGKIACARQHRPRSRAEIYAQFSRHNLRQRGFAKTRRAGEQHMIQRLTAPLGGFDEDGEIFTGLRLADELRQCLGSQARFEHVFFDALGRDETFGLRGSRFRHHQSLLRHMAQAFADEHFHRSLSQFARHTPHRFARLRRRIATTDKCRDRVGLRAARSANADRFTGVTA